MMLVNAKRIYKIVRLKLRIRNTKIKQGANFSIRTQFEGCNVLGRGTWLDGYIGYGSYLGDGCLFEGKIGRYCSISHKVNVLTGRHPAHQFVSTCPSFFSMNQPNGLSYVLKQKYKEKVYADEENKYGVIIGNDVWIGYGATLMGGVKIGDGAIIGANSYVNKDVPPYSIVVGQPAKVIGTRFPEEQSAFLLKFKWWEKPEEWIKENAEFFEDIDKFMKKCYLEDKVD